MATERIPVKGTRPGKGVGVGGGIPVGGGSGSGSGPGTEIPPEDGKGEEKEVCLLDALTNYTSCKAGARIRYGKVYSKCSKYTSGALLEDCRTQASIVRDNDLDACKLEYERDKVAC